MALGRIYRFNSELSNLIKNLPESRFSSFLWSSLIQKLIKSSDRSITVDQLEQASSIMTATIFEMILILFKIGYFQDFQEVQLSNRKPRDMHGPNLYHELESFHSNSLLGRVTERPKRVRDPGNIKMILEYEPVRCL